MKDIYKPSVSCERKMERLVVEPQEGREVQIDGQRINEFCKCLEPHGKWSPSAEQDVCKVFSKRVQDEEDIAVNIPSSID